MMLRLGATMGAIAPVAMAVATKDGSAMMTEPTIWFLLGYPVEAGSLIAGLCACLAVRFYVGLSAGKHSWTLDVPVSALALMFTVGLVVKMRPEPIFALLLGTALGALGAGIIAIAKRYLDQVLGPIVGQQPDGPSG